MAKVMLFNLYSGNNLVTQNITRDRVEVIAKAYGFKKKSVAKLLNGPDKFNFIRGGGYELTKVFVSEEQLSGLKLNDDTPLMERTSALLKRLEAHENKKEEVHHG